MTDFSHLKKADVQDSALAKFDLGMLEGDMFLMVAPATDANKPYFNALLRRNKKALRHGVKTLTVAVIDDNRNIDRELYGEYIIKSWNVKDALGASVQLTKENAIEFLHALPDWIIDDLRKFTSDPTNFTNEQFDVEEETKN